MKRIIMFILLIVSGLIYCQSLQSSDLEDFVTSQTIEEISNTMTSKGFVKSEELQNDLLYTNFKKDDERITLVVNNQLFSVVYKTNVSNAVTKANSFISMGYKYSHTYKNNEYYDSSDMRIGLNRINGILTLIKHLRSQ